MGKCNEPFMEVELHKWVHAHWPGPVFKKIGMFDQYLCAFFVKEGRRPKNEDSHFWISIHYEFVEFRVDENGQNQVVFAVENQVRCELIDDDQQVTLKSKNQESRDYLKSITGTADFVVYNIEPVEKMPMLRVSCTNGSRGAIVEDVYWRYKKS
jgi:hypothetical protein